MKTKGNVAPAKGLTYAAAGVDIDAGDRVVDLIKPLVQRTYGKRVMGAHDAFAGMLRLDRDKSLFKRNWRRPVLVACTDGVGTKVLLAAERRIFDTVGIDCVAMNVNDLIVQRAEPLLFLDYLGLSKVSPADTAKMVEGVVKGCQLAGCALIGGECAEMPDIYKPGDFDIAGFCVGVVELSHVKNAPKVRRGDVIIGLASSGIHSNGYTLVRRIIRDARLNLDRVYPELSDSPLWQVLLEPTRIYAKQIVELLSQSKRRNAVTAMAHITGGGLPGNVCRGLPKGMDAVIDTNAWVHPAIFAFLQAHGGVATGEMFRVFNMGIGYTLCVRPECSESVLRKLRKLGETATVIGVIAKGTGSVVLR